MIEEDSPEKEIFMVVRIIREKLISIQKMKYLLLQVKCTVRDWATNQQK